MCCTGVSLTFAWVGAPSTAETCDARVAATSCTRSAPAIASRACGALCPLSRRKLEEPQMSVS
eukprot:10179993-Alexandrium_andersonii.AAC.1